MTACWLIKGVNDPTIEKKSNRVVVKGGIAWDIEYGGWGWARERETVCFWVEQIKATAIGCMDAGKNCTLVKDWTHGWIEKHITNLDFSISTFVCFYALPLSTTGDIPVALYSWQTDNYCNRKFLAAHSRPIISSRCGKAPHVKATALIMTTKHHTYWGEISSIAVCENYKPQGKETQVFNVNRSRRWSQSSTLKLNWLLSEPCWALWEVYSTVKIPALPQESHYHHSPLISDAAGLF